jgi:hypothetical protein
MRAVTRMTKFLCTCTSFVPAALLLLVGCDWRNELPEPPINDPNRAIAHTLFVDATIDDIVGSVELGEATAVIIYANWVCCADPMGGLGHKTITAALADRQILTMTVDLTNVDADAMTPLSEMGVAEIPALLLFNSGAGEAPVILSWNESDQAILAAIARVDL